MTIQHRGAAGPYTEYDNLPVLHATETDLPLLPGRRPRGQRKKGHPDRPDTGAARGPG
ncbi:DUF6420 family protein [Streptomyces sp. NPDC050856]|uniref:DUF6420 family protein n=1 Tax=Streptomyces sp. NPDC050856 TaxID=3154939 RepID=UPI0033DD0AD9